MLDVEYGANVSRAVAGEALVRPAKRMRCEDDIVQLQDWIRGVRGLLLKHIKPGPGNAALLKRLRESLLVDNGPPSSVDEICGRLHQGQAFCVDKVMRLRGQRAADAHNIG